MKKIVVISNCKHYFKNRIAEKLKTIYNKELITKKEEKNGKMLLFNDRNSITLLCYNKKRRTYRK